MRQLQQECCAVVLSGGLNSRMAGRNKAFLDIGGRPIIDRLLCSLEPFFQEILLVTRQSEAYAGLPVRVVTDIYAARSSMTGVHAGLVHAVADNAFVVPCDTPFLQPAVIRLLLDAWSPEWDGVVPLMDGRYQPLCAIYSKRCIPMIAAQLDSGDYRIFKIFEKMRVKTLSAETLRRADPQLLSFFNVNTPSAHVACRQLIKTS